jgi:NlpC/P60 family putative phage cell wall peptidase
MSGEAGTNIAAAIVAEALAWLGTPYRHQGCTKQVGCDCLGLVRGVWCAVYGSEPAAAGAYAPDWAEAGGRDRLMEAARKHCLEKPAVTMAAGDLLVFRWQAHLPAKHLGILIDSNSFVHAYQGHQVLISALVPGWRRRIAGVFAFPPPERVQVTNRSD